MQQLALKIETPDQHAKALHPGGIGKVTIARKEPYKRWVQNSYSLNHLPEIVRLLKGQPDVFISQNRFFGSRLIARLAQLDALFADLDYYRIPSLRNHTPEQIHGLAREYLEDANMPQPNLAIATGRGVALLWLHLPVPRQALPRWMVCQKHLYNTLKPLGADCKALDAARVLRLIGTTNDTAKVLVRALNNVTTAYHDFETLAEDILPHPRAEIKSLSIERSLKKQLRLNRPPKQFTAATLWEGRLAELQALRKHRHDQGKLPAGQRSNWLFIAGVAMSWLAPPTAMQRELYGLAREVAGWDDRESKTRMQAALKRAWQAARGETVTWNGQQLDARYHFKDSTICEWLDITSEEMEVLGFKHLVSDNTKAERHRQRSKEYMRQKRRKSGIQTRDAYEHQAEERRARALELREQGMTKQQVAAEMGITVEAARNLLKRANKKGGGQVRCVVWWRSLPSLWIVSRCSL